MRTNGIYHTSCEGTNCLVIHHWVATLSTQLLTHEPIVDTGVYWHHCFTEITGWQVPLVINGRYRLALSQWLHINHPIFPQPFWLTMKTKQNHQQHAWKSAINWYKNHQLPTSPTINQTHHENQPRTNYIGVACTISISHQTSPGC